MTADKKLYTPVASPESSLAAATSFTLGVWVRGSPTPGTSAIIADATGPGVDSAEPAANRILVCGARRNLVFTSGTGVLKGIVIGGTSVVVQVWFYDGGLLKWVKCGPPLTITVATSNLGTLTGSNIGYLVGAKMYVQLVTVTGAVTEFGYDF